MANHYQLPWYSIVIAIALNFALIGVGQGIFGEDTIKGVEYSYLQPDSTTFIVWTPIYLFHVIFAIYQSLPSVRDWERLGEVRFSLCCQYILNGLWLVVNGAAARGFSNWLAVIVLISNVVCLAYAYYLLRVDYTDLSVPFLYRSLIFNAVSCNLAWVVLASILNVTNTVYEPTRTPAVGVGSADWAIGVLGLATVIACYLGFTRFDVGYAVVFMWACGGFVRPHLMDGTLNPGIQQNDNLGYMAVGCIVLTSISTIAGGIAFFISSRGARSGGETKSATSIVSGDVSKV